MLISDYELALADGRPVEANAAGLWFLDQTSLHPSLMWRPTLGAELKIARLLEAAATARRGRVWSSDHHRTWHLALKGILTYVEGTFRVD